MAEPLKNIYNPQFLEEFGELVRQTLPRFSTSTFVNQIIDDLWPQRELKDRMDKIAEVLITYLPDNEKDCLLKVMEISNRLWQQKSKMAFEFMFLPAIIEKKGQTIPKIAIQAMEEVTRFTSCEFAVRIFIKNHPEMMMKQMLKWTRHREANVRRFASEGCRPRLPWAMALEFLKKDPSPIIPILESLKEDDSEFVQKSVANNINDISKDHPELVVALSKRWIGKSGRTDWILKHGNRTLLKSGHQESLVLFHLKFDDSLRITSLQMSPKRIRMGETLSFQFRLDTGTGGNKKIRLEYVLYFLRKNQTYSKKVFMIHQKEYEGGDKEDISKKHSFREITTRKYYPGRQYLGIVVNGRELTKRSFELVE